MNISTGKLAVVLPCFNEEAVLPETISRLEKLMDERMQDILIDDYILLFVDDGSSDSTWKIIEEAHSKDSHVKGLKLACNVGHQNALMAGLEHAKSMADMIVSIDCDLQDDIEVIPEMVKKYSEGFDIVFGVRSSRKVDSWFKRTSALAFYKLMGALGVRTIYNHADFRLLSRRAVEHLCTFRERNLFLRGMVPLIGYASTSVYYNRQRRVAGTTKYPFRKMMNFAIDGITSFSVKPVRLVMTMGILFITVAFIILLYAIIAYWTGNVVPGWTSLILSVWFVGGCILMGLGIIGEYVGKIYIEVKDRPRFNIEKVID